MSPETDCDVLVNVNDRVSLLLSVSSFSFIHHLLSRGAATLKNSRRGYPLVISIGDGVAGWWWWKYLGHST